MNNDSSKSKIMTLLSSESPRKRISGIKKARDLFNEEIIDYLILLLQLDEKKKVRKEVLLTFSELEISNKSLAGKVTHVIVNAAKNEPEKELQIIAEQSLEKIKNRNS